MKNKFILLIVALLSLCGSTAGAVIDQYQYAAPSGGGGAGWAQVGSTLTLNVGSSFPDGMSATRGAMFDNVTDCLQAYSVAADTWTAEGNCTSFGAVNNDNRFYGSGDGTTGVASINGTSWFKVSFDGTDWAQIGNSINLGVDGNGYMLTSTRMVIIQRSPAQVCMYDHDGTDWIVTGSCYAYGTADFQRQAITCLDETNNAERCILWSNNLTDFVTIDFNGASWSTVGNAYDLGATENRLTFAKISNTEFAYYGQTSEFLYYCTHDGTNITCSDSVDRTATNQAAIGAYDGRKIMFYTQTTGIETWQHSLPE